MSSSPKSTTVSSQIVSSAKKEVEKVGKEVEKVVSEIKQNVTSTCRRFEKNAGLKFKYSLYSALAFFLLASPQMFTFVNSFIGWIVKIAEPNGCPTQFGLVLHTIVFLGLLYLMMSLPKDQN
jgi:hypothetical protein